MSSPSTLASRSGPRHHLGELRQAYIIVRHPPRPPSSLRQSSPSSDQHHGCPLPLQTSSLSLPLSGVPPALPTSSSPSPRSPPPSPDHSSMSASVGVSKPPQDPVVPPIAEPFSVSFFLSICFSYLEYLHLILCVFGLVSNVLMCGVLSLSPSFSLDVYLC